MKTHVLANAATPFESADLDAEVKRFLTKVWSHRRNRKPARVTDPVAVYQISEDALREADPLASARRNGLWAVIVEDGVKAQVMLLNDFGGRPSAMAMPEQSQNPLLAAMRLGRGIDPEAEMRWLLVDGASSAAWIANEDDVIIPAMSRGTPVDRAEADPDFLAGLSGSHGPSR